MWLSVLAIALGIGGAYTALRHRGAEDGLD
jgi:hypothetical protein